MASKKKFYAVRKGVVPGIYESWDDCQKQVLGFEGAEFKGFKTREEAERYINPSEEQVKPVTVDVPVQTAQAAPNVTSFVGRSKPLTAQTAWNNRDKISAYYAVKHGKVPGVYDNWQACKAQTDFFPGADFKKFDNWDEADVYVRGLERMPDVRPKGEKPVKPDWLPDGPFAFVDGSFNAETGVYGYGGFIEVDGERTLLSGCGYDEDMAVMRNVAGEISGAMAAVKEAEKMGLREITLLYDYYGIERWATGEWSANKKWTADYQDFMNPENRSVQVSFQKVKAHSGIDGNEIADVLAKTSVAIHLTPKEQTVLSRVIRMNDGDAGLCDDEDENNAEFEM